MLKLDATLTAVETVEAEVDSLYQSVNQVNIALEGYASQPCEAFVCGVSPGEKGRVYAGINLMQEKKTLVYAAGNLGADRGRYDEALQEALDFLEPLGFQLKEVNLSYSAAMRQVILKGVTGIRIPGSAKPEWKQRLEEVVATQEATVVTTAKETAKKGLKPQVAPPPAPEEKPVPAAPEPPPRKREGGDDVTAMLRIDIARLEEKVAELEAEAAPRKTRLGNLERELQGARDGAAAAADERERVKREADKAAATANRTIAALKKELDGTKAELESLKGRVEEDQKELRTQVKSLQKHNDELEKRRAHEQEDLSRRLAAAETEAAGLQASRLELEQRLRQQEEDHEQELVRLVAQSAEAEVRGDEQLQMHRRATHERLAALRQVMDRLWESVGDEAMPAGDDLLQQLATTLLPSLRVLSKASARSQQTALPAARQTAGEEMPPAVLEERDLSSVDADEEASAEAQTERPVQPPPAPAEGEPPRGEEPSGAAETVLAADDGRRSRVAELFFPVEEKGAAPPAEAAAPSSGGGTTCLPAPAEPPADTFASFDLSGSFSGEAATPFILDGGAAELTVAAAGLQAIYRSANVQRIAPAGGSPEEGRAYICAFREGGTERVAAILEMTKGGERFVYLPQDPSLDRASLVRSAHCFMEDIGFFMLEEPLAEDMAERRECLEGWAPFISWDR